ncbi:MAG: hypothetical protein MJD61_03120 [Proteobacteria bacterium]|nr:hypothetical protein [Pseudomonadota bacterium]
MAEPASYTDVIDAFDEQKGFDMDVRIGFVRRRVAGRVVREGAGSPAGRAHHIHMLDHVHSTNNLVVGLRVGLYRDLMLYSTLPLVLSDERLLRVPAGRTASEIDSALLAPVPSSFYSRPPAPRDRLQYDRLFALGDRAHYQGPARSGFDWVGFGLAWGLTNQFRRPGLPNWVAMVEGRFGLGEPMRAGKARAVSRGTHALRFETRTSRRYRYLEPLAGVAFQAEWPVANRAVFGVGQGLPRGALTRPPRSVEAVVGVAIVPWESRARFQRVTVDLRLLCSRLSRGRDYGPLFDALGTSSSPFLTLMDPTARDPTPGPMPRFAGLTDTDSYARMAAQAGVVIRAARYVGFTAGVRLARDTPHWITGGNRCFDNTIAATGSLACGAGTPNPQHRAVIDQPGQRFRLEGQVLVEVYTHATGHF